jgi:YVTN family beta-propeller protein
VAVDQGTHTVYVADKFDATVSVIDGSARTITATVHVGGSPMGVAVDPNTHTVFVTDSHGWTVSVIDGRKHTVTGTMAEKIRDIRHVEFGGMAPSGLAVDPGSHTVYVANHGDNSVWVFEHR